jgi:hypothetical protein
MDLLKVDMPDIRQSVDRARNAMETLTMAVARSFAHKTCGGEVQHGAAASRRKAATLRV